MSNNPMDRLFRQFDGEDGSEDPFFSGGMLGQHPFAASSTSGYHIHQNEKEVMVEVELPGVAAKDIKVEVWQPNSNACMLQWSGTRAVGRKSKSQLHEQQQQRMNFSNRLRFGPQVDCDQVAANLSRGILWLTAPLKEKTPEQAPQTRAIPIQEGP